MNIFINQIKKYDKYLIFVLVYTLLFFLFAFTFKYTFPFVAGALIAYILVKPSEYLINKFKIKTKLSTFITTLIFYLIIGAILSVLSIVLIVEIKSILSKLDVNALVVNINNLKLTSIDLIKKIDKNISDTIMNNIQSIISYLSSIAGNVLKSILGSISSIPYILMTSIFTILSTYFILNELIERKLSLNNHSDKEYGKIVEFIKHAKEMGGKYIGAYLTLIIITFIEAFILLTLTGSKYAVLLALVCAIFDLMPVIGIGSVFAPYALISYMNGNIRMSIFLLIAWGIMVAVRQYLEPKLLSNSLDIPPILTLMAVFIGLNSFGIIGILFFVFMIITFKVCKKINLL